jgi:hypothetical protein
MKNNSAQKPAALALAPIDRSTLCPAESRMIAAARRLDLDVRDFYIEVIENRGRDHPRESLSNRSALRLIQGGLAS